MEGLKLAEIAAQFGPWGLILVLWWLSDRSRERQINQHRQEIQQILQLYQRDMAEQREMYKNNVHLVEAYAQLTRQTQGLADDLKDVVLINTQAVTAMCSDINSNQFCPMVRLQKQASGRVE